MAKGKKKVSKTKPAEKSKKISKNKKVTKTVRDTPKLTKKTSKATSVKSEQTEEEKLESKKVNPRKLVYYGRSNYSGQTIAQQMEKVWGPTVKKLLNMSPEETQKEIEECEYTPFQKNQIGNLLNTYLKKQSQLGVKSTKYIYNAAQTQIFNKKLEDYSQLTIVQLKEIMKNNNQGSTDTKDLLVFRAADGFTLGQIPKCPKCFGGRLKFNNKTGEYSCPGYVDGGDNCVKGDDYIFCNSRFKYEEISREKWIE